MRFFYFLTGFLLLFVVAWADFYGSDKDVIPIQRARNEKIQVLGRSLAIKFNRIDILETNNEQTLIKTTPYREMEYTCSEEAFSEEAVLSDFNCTVFLVDPTHVMTAGHCITPQACQVVSFLFGYDEPISANQKNGKWFSNRDIYQCKSVTQMHFDETEVANRVDWAVVELDRPVRDRAPLKRSIHATAKNDQKIFMLGFPGGLSLRYSEGRVMGNVTNSGYFDSNLDAFGGNSGSPVFNSQTFEVIGIFNRGQTTLNYDGKANCYRHGIFPEDGTGSVLESTTIIDRVPY